MEGLRHAKTKGFRVVGHPEIAADFTGFSDNLRFAAWAIAPDVMLCGAHCPYNEPKLASVPNCIADDPQLIERARAQIRELTLGAFVGLRAHCTVRDDQSPASMCMSKGLGFMIREGQLHIHLSKGPGDPGWPLGTEEPVLCPQVVAYQHPEGGSVRCGMQWGNNSSLIVPGVTEPGGSHYLLSAELVFRFRGLGVTPTCNQPSYPGSLGCGEQGVDVGHGPFYRASLLSYSIKVGTDEVARYSAADSKAGGTSQPGSGGPATVVTGCDPYIGGPNAPNSKELHDWVRSYRATEWAKVRRGPEAPN